MSWWQLDARQLVPARDVVLLRRVGQATEVVRRRAAPQRLAQRSRTLIQRLADPRRRLPGTTWRKRP